MRTIYYEDELKDEFSRAKITPRRIDGTYRYLRERPLERIFSFLLYRILAQPLGWLFLKLFRGHRIYGAEKLRQVPEGTPIYLYGNHTNAALDPFIPSMITYRRGTRVIVHPANVSMKWFGWLMPYLGALPLPDDRAAMGHFQETLQTLAKRGKCVTIYPEAHIWPYCTWIRPFTAASFHYPVEHRAAVFSFVNTYHKGPLGGLRIKTYVDGPFAVDPSPAPRAARGVLRDQVYEAMCARAKNNTCELIRYVKKETPKESEE